MQLTRQANHTDQKRQAVFVPAPDKDDPLARLYLPQRALDISIASVGLFCLWPLFLLIAVAARLQDGGPIFYRARRVGRGGRLFHLFKFRTMITGADKIGAGITTSGDARVTPIGRILRRTKLDELPQLLNVLRGEMSLVGPRPEDHRYVVLYNDEQRRVLMVRPGITSAASLAYSREEELLSGPDWESLYRTQIMPAKLDLDLDYLAHRTLWSDLRLILRTIARVLSTGYLGAIAGFLKLTLNAVTERLLTLPTLMRNRHLMALELVLFLLTPALALQLRLDEEGGAESYGASLLVLTATFLAIKLLIFFPGGLYSRYWRYAAIPELAQIAALGTLVLLTQTLALTLLLRPLALVAADFPRSVPVIEALIAIPIALALRFSVPVATRLLRRRAHDSNSLATIIVGAQDAGIVIAEEMKRNPALGLRPVAFVDDDLLKQGLRISGVPVLGHTADIQRIARYTRARQVVIALPDAAAGVIRELIELCEEHGIQARTVPGIYDVLGGLKSPKKTGEVTVEQLLGREPVKTDTASVAEFVSGRRVLVTGGGGSIGSELCRQLLSFNPSQLIVLGHGEGTIFETCSELSDELDRRSISAPLDCVVVPVIADIRHADRITAVFVEFAPELVFHAAAHKHVPLMEANPVEAVTNNILGTRNLLQAAQEYGVKHFVMISTDKAVNPTSVMGASKRIAELLVREAANQNGQDYVAVRFGNVLGSRGSVVPTFRRQIKAGGPLTITHPDMVRYFMTISEAVQLVLQAATIGKGGEVFMLDMGKPVRILDLARDMIRLSGMEPDRDIAISYTGLRPGEKLFEEMFTSGEKYAPTLHERIFVASDAAARTQTSILESITALEAAATRNDKGAILRQLQQLLPEYRSQQAVKLNTAEADSSKKTTQDSQPRQAAVQQFAPAHVEAGSGQ